MPFAAGIYYSYYDGNGKQGRMPVVLLHGAGGNHLYWPSEIRRLQGYPVYALDLPGHGRSEGPGHQSVGDYATSVFNWMDAAGLHQVVLVGHSMGGAIALSMALRYPDRVAALILLGSGARLRVAPAILDSAASPTTFHNAIAVVINWAFSPQTPAALTALAEKRMAETRQSVFYADFLACDAFDETTRLQEIHLPALVITGMDDRMTPLRYAQFLVDHIPGSELKLVPNAGHMVMLEQPRLVAELVHNFLSRTFD